MEPTLFDGDALEVRPYDFPVARGDVIAFYSPVAPTRVFFKRVIAGPGDSVRIDSPSGTIRVNGEPVDEPYARGPTTCASTLCLFDVPPFEGEAVPQPGANPISFEPGVGPGITPGPGFDADRQQAWCQQSACYFVLGDNRQNSSDSRQGWLVPVENIIGYVEIEE